MLALDGTSFPKQESSLHMTELLPVQKEGLKHGLNKPGFAYYMEMGLGKTLLALTEFLTYAARKDATRLVVFCPNSFKTGWLDEIQKYGLKVHPHIYDSGNDYANGQFLKAKYESPPILIINYEAIRKEEVQDYIRTFIRPKPSMLVVDESIQIKTPKSQQTKAALQLAPHFVYRRVLSGKPITQGPHDLWAQMTAIGAIRDRFYPFKVTFCKMGGFKGKKVVGTQNEALLAAKIDKFIFRASKKDWTDLPPKMYTSREYKLTPKLAAYYKSMEDDFVLWLTESENVAVDTFITKYIKLAQIQSGFIIKEDGSIEELVASEENPRFVLVREVVEECAGKVVIPYIHRYTLNLLSRALAEYNPTFISGSMEPGEIQANKDKFNKDDSCRVILVQTRAGKYGHTLLGGLEANNNCHTMIFAENSYSLDDRSQIEDRIHRHGQTADHCMYIDVWGTPLDHKVTMALQAKESIAKAAFQHFKDRRASTA